MRAESQRAGAGADEYLFERHGRLWVAPHSHWAQAFEQMLARRAKLTLPLANHGYLLEILAGIADKAAGAVVSNTSSPYIWEYEPTYHEFVCPGCKKRHALNLGPGGWQVQSWVPLTIVPSILVTGGGDPKYRCHSFIRNSRIEFLHDCSHALAGKTVPLVDFDAWVAEQRRLQPEGE